LASYARNLEDGSTPLIEFLSCFEALKNYIYRPSPALPVPALGAYLWDIPGLHVRKKHFKCTN
ncbi:MAG: hypothetical protein K1W00_05310, partial [Lachnospiraceae bacterium]